MYNVTITLVNGKKVFFGAIEANNTVDAQFQAIDRANAESFTGKVFYVEIDVREIV